MSILNDNDMESRISETQGEIYEMMANKGYNMEIFSNAFLNSSFCERAFDTTYSRFQLADAEESADFYLPEIESSLIFMEKDFQFSGETAYWIGYIYRLLYFKTGLPSKEIIKKLSFEDMCNCYPGLHTVDDDYILEILIKKIISN